MKPPLISIAAALALSVGLAGCGKAPPAAEPVIIRPVLTMVVHPAATTPPSFVGTITPQVSTNLSFRVGGRIVARPVDIGSLIGKNDVLASIDPTALQLAVQSATASLASAQAQLTLGQNELDRQQALVQANATPQSTLDQAQQQLASAQSAVVRAQSNLSQAQQQLSDAQITAPYDGIVTDTKANVGSVVAGGDTVLTMARTDGRYAVIDIPEAQGLDVKVGSAFTVTLQLDPAIAVAGLVREVAPQVNTATGTRQIKIGLVDPPPTFWIGTTVTATLQGLDANTLSVPATAVLQDQTTAQVWVVDPASMTVTKHAVKLGPADGAVFPVSSGLVDGTRIVTAGVHELKDGQKVSLAEGTSL